MDPPRGIPGPADQIASDRDLADVAIRVERSGVVVTSTDERALQDQSGDRSVLAIETPRVLATPTDQISGDCHDADASESADFSTVLARSAPNRTADRHGANRSRCTHHSAAGASTPDQISFDGHGTDIAGAAD